MLVLRTNRNACSSGVSQSLQSRQKWLELRRLPQILFYLTRTNFIREGLPKGVLFT